MPADRTRLIVPAVLVAALGVACSEKAAPPPPPPPEVYVTPVVQKDVPVYLELVGQTSGYQDVEIRARVEGFLEKVAFREGSFVKKGQLLYEIDRKPLEAVRAAAAADVATAKAKLSKADNDVARYKPLVSKQAVSQQELDNALSAQEAARSALDAATAALDKATFDLGYTKITSPIDGLVGTTLVKAGNLVGRGESTLLTTVSQIDPILFKVGVTEAEFLRLVKRDPARSGAEPTAAGMELTLADGTVHPQTGHLGAVERAVNASTGTLGMQVIFPNPQFVLRPGQYGRVRALVENRPGALLVPQRAVQALQNLYSVAVVGADNKVAFRNVKVGPRIESMWVIEEGLKPGEQVVAEGLQAITDGMTVRTRPLSARPGQPAVETASEAK